jgi:hypothetical protein
MIRTYDVRAADRAYLLHEGQQLDEGSVDTALDARG